jgi:hypothetical protein
MLPLVIARVLAPAGDSPALQKGPPTMPRSPGAAGFVSQCAPVSSSRLIDAVAASLVFGAFSLSLIVTLTVLSIRASVAMPF